MTGEFFFALLNPAIAAVLAAAFLVVWRLRRANRYLIWLAFAFLASGVAFAANDFLDPWDGPALRLFVNGTFLAAVMALAVSALVRVGAPIPVRAYALVVMVGAIGFCWYLFVEPSVGARVYLTNAVFAALAIVTLWRLVKAGSRGTIDHLFLALVASVLVLSIGRPLVAFYGILDLNAGGPLRDSDYWATIQALTPPLAIALTLVFLSAIVVQWVSEVRALADRDYLTGLLNRRGFAARVEAMLERSVPGPKVPGVLIVDIDDFKAINDTFGHAMGDQVIEAVARGLLQHGHAEFVARTGGEEFALFYRETRRGEVLRRAETIRLELAGMRIDDAISVTVSIGIHTRHQHETLPQMLDQADRALYEAKHSGKNRAVMSPLGLRPVLADRLAV